MHYSHNTLAITHEKTICPRGRKHYLLKFSTAKILVYAVYNISLAELKTAQRIRTQNLAPVLESFEELISVYSFFLYTTHMQWV